MHLEKRKGGPGGTAQNECRLSKIDSLEDSLSRNAAQRRLALRIAAGAGLSIAVATVLVLIALGDGGRA